MYCFLTFLASYVARYVCKLRIDTGSWSVNCSTLGFRGLCNHPHQLKFNFPLILYVYLMLYQMI